MSVAVAHRMRLWLRSHSLLWRRPIRKVRTFLSIAKYRIRHRFGREHQARVVPVEAPMESEAPQPPLIGVITPSGTSRTQIRSALADQTETSWTLDAEQVGATPFLWCPDGAPGNLEATQLESLLITAVACDLLYVVGGWSPSSTEPGLIRRPKDTNDADLTLLRRPHSRQPGREVVARLVPHISSGENRIPIRAPGLASDPWLLDRRSGAGTVVRLPCRPVHELLKHIPQEPGPRTALFLLPFLAVGGAEQLLFDLLEGLAPHFRCLVVTLEPHRAELGQTVERCRAITAHTYTLGDWLPREARWSALHHLIRRWNVETLISWNGTVDFYDRGAALCSGIPNLRLLVQLYNHEGGWIDHLTDKLVARADGHLAVNELIAQALEERGVPAEKIHTVHHGVEAPELPENDQRLRAGRDCRSRLGLPPDALVVGTFVRLHPQKRPLDVIRLARRLANREVWFVLVGGGPMDEEVDREIRRDPPPNLIRLPMQSNVRPLFDALDLCLMTSEYEGLPVFLLEGLAREIPCVTTNTGEVAELLADGGGILVPQPGDLDALESGIIELHDPEKRRSEGRKGRATVLARFSLTEYVERYRELIFP